MAPTSGAGKKSRLVSAINYNNGITNNKMQT